MKKISWLHISALSLKEEVLESWELSLELFYTNGVDEMKIDVKEIIKARSEQQE